MKKLTIATEKVLAAYNVLSSAKYSKLDDADKIKVWKITRALKPVAEKFDEDSKDAAEKMKPEGYDEILPKAQEYERMMKDSEMDASKLPMGAAEYQKFVEEFKAYNKLVGDSISDFAKKEVEVEVEQLSEDAFGKLMASNDWNMAQVGVLDGVVTE